MFYYLVISFVFIFVCIYLLDVYRNYTGENISLVRLGIFLVIYHLGKLDYVLANMLNGQ